MNEVSESIQDYSSAIRSTVWDALLALGGHDLEGPSTLTFGPTPNPQMGDLALPCFVFRGKLAALDDKARNNPAAIAARLAAEILPNAWLEAVGSAGPYLNLTYRLSTLAQVVVREAIERGAAFGGAQVEPQHVVIEFSAPNTNKPQHLGHVRNNVLGESVSRCLAHWGHRVTRVNLVNDRGIHICKSMLAYQLWGDGCSPESLGQKGDHLVGDFYVMFEKRFREEYDLWQQSADGDAAFANWSQTPEGRKAVEGYEKWRATKDVEPAVDAKKKPGRAPQEPRAQFVSGYRDEYFNAVSPLGTQARALLVGWEANEPSIRALWSQLNGWVLEGFNQTYARLGVRFDKVYYESQTYTLGKELVQQGLERGVFYKDETGAVFFDTESIGLPGTKVVQRSDGTSVYITQDLGTALMRHAELGYERMIYVVANEQDYHFKVLFGVLGALEKELEGRFEHLSYGMVTLPRGMGKMKSREGTAVDADELLDEMKQLARKEIEAKLVLEHYTGIDEVEIGRRAEAIGQAALKYYLLDVSPASTMVFDPEKSLDFAGRTGAYCLYAYARTRSLLRKSGWDDSQRDFAALAMLRTEEEKRVVKELMAFHEAVRWAGESRDPSRIAEYLFNLCKSFAFIFTDKKGHPIISCDDPTLRKARIQLVEALGVVLAIGLDLLGIETLEEM